MKRFSLRFGLALAVVLAVGTIHSGRSGAQNLQIQRAQLVPLTGAAALRAISNCPAAPANASLTLGSGVPTVEQTSPNSGYGTDTCNRYVVDIAVPSNTTAPGGYQNRFGPWGDDFSNNGVSTGVSQQECSSFHVDVTYYKKAAGAASFTQIGGGRLNGTWVGDGPMFGANSCHLNQAAGFQTPPQSTPPSNGTDVYRVAVRSYTSASLRKVKAGASRAPNPPA